MTTACPCFGRNENCRLCNGTGLIASEVEAKVARSRVPKDYSVQTDVQIAFDAAAKQKPKFKYKQSTAEKKLKFIAAQAAEESRQVAAAAVKVAAAKYKAEQYAKQEVARAADERIKAGRYPEMLRRIKLQAELEAKLAAEPASGAANLLHKRKLLEFNLAATLEAEHAQKHAADMATLNMTNEKDANLAQRTGRKRGEHRQFYRCIKCNYGYSNFDAKAPCAMCGNKGEFTGPYSM